MKDMSQYLWTTSHGANNNSIHLKDSKFAIAFCWLAKDHSCSVFKIRMVEKLIMLRLALVKMFFMIIF